MGRLKTLKPRVATLQSQRRTLRDVTPQRLGGQAGQNRRERWLRQHPLCKECQDEDPPRVTAGEEVDHVVPLWQNGADDDSNLQTLCRAHHKLKTAREYRERMGHLPR